MGLQHGKSFATATAAGGDSNFATSSATALALMCKPNLVLQCFYYAQHRLHRAQRETELEV